MTQQDWARIKDDIRYRWQTDSYFDELKASAIWNSRMTLLGLMDPYKNVYFSEKWIAREVLKFTDDEIASIREEFDDVAGEVLPPGGKPDELKPGFGEEDADTEDGFDVDQGKEGDEDATVIGNKDLDDEADSVLTSTKDKDDEDDDEDAPVKGSGKITFANKKSSSNDDKNDKKPFKKNKDKTGKKPPFGKKSK
jgi:hypothetical protein